MHWSRAAWSPSSASEARGMQARAASASERRSTIPPRSEAEALDHLRAAHAVHGVAEDAMARVERREARGAGLGEACRGGVERLRPGRSLRAIDLAGEAQRVRRAVARPRAAGHDEPCGLARIVVRDPCDEELLAQLAH